MNAISVSQIYFDSIFNLNRRYVGYQGAFKTIEQSFCGLIQHINIL